MSEENRKYLSANQAAEYIGISRSTFDKLVKTGKIPIGKQLTKRLFKWDRDELDRYMGELDNEPETEDPDNRI